MAEPVLHRLQVTAGFEQGGGEGVAQSMDPARLADARAQRGQRRQLLGDGDVDGAASPADWRRVTRGAAECAS
jgi:hypothetical protein